MTKASTRIAESTDRAPPPRPRHLRKTSLDKDLGKIGHLEEAARSISRTQFAPGFAILFLAVAALIASYHIGAEHNAFLAIAAAVIGGYMALNIGANDVANNVGPAVGAKALTMTGALLMAAVFESSGALIAGSNVVETISRGIIDPASVPDSKTFVWIMMSALLASALWVHLATFLGAPVSTTHAIVGAVMGAGIVAVGTGAVDWYVIWVITVSWILSPIFGGIIAAMFLAFIKINIIYQDDKIAAARRWVPALIALMASCFSIYLLLKGLDNVWTPPPAVYAVLAAAIFVAVHLMVRPWVYAQSEGMENRNQSLRKLFHLPLICSAALLSFAHGANDVANAVGPLAAIIHSAGDGGMPGTVALPFWVMLIGAAGISLGLFLYGPRLVRMVGEQITRMNPMRAFSVALSAAITVIVASSLGLPVSSTHIAVGAVFGVGFFREYYTTHSRRRRKFVKKKHLYASRAYVNTDELLRRKLVRRSHFTGIIAAWVITVPAAALLAALLYSAIVRVI
jgi:PiT family inorganic phosphate transporter